MFTREPGPAEISAPQPPDNPIGDDASHLFRVYAQLVQDGLAEAQLACFLSTAGNLQHSVPEQPELTVIIVVHNRDDLTFQCLWSLSIQDFSSYEVIIVDNASTDRTSVLLKRIDGARVIRNEENLHFIRAANQAAKEARGEFLLFLNNDTKLFPGSVASAVKTIRSSDDIGVVGGRLIFPNGILQEAGGILWNDGTCEGYGRGDNPSLYKYLFQRDVDYCSGAFLLTRKNVFVKTGGFDNDYEPAYYEDVDYCRKLWDSGMRVVYDPGAALLHYEFASATPEEALALQTSHRVIFCRKHPLQGHADPGSGNQLRARNKRKFSHTVLLLEEYTPHPYLGAGYPRTHRILSALLQLGCFVTVHPTRKEEEWREVYRDIPGEVEVLIGRGSLESILEERKNYYGVLIVSRPKNWEAIRNLRCQRPDLFHGMRIIYDTEALASIRDAAAMGLNEQETKDLIQHETELASEADCVVAVSETEKQILLHNGVASVEVLGYAVAANPGERTFAGRHGFLFVGAIHDDATPNADSVLWFMNEIFPILRKELGSEATVTLAGLNHSDRIASIRCEGLLRAGAPDDLTAVYDAARVFVAPTRFGAGIPIKVLDAAAHGVPVVATSLVAKQLGWQDGVELLTGDGPAEFAQQCIRLYQNDSIFYQLRMNALERIHSECAPEQFRVKVNRILHG